MSRTVVKRALISNKNIVLYIRELVSHFIMKGENLFELQKAIEKKRNKMWDYIGNLWNYYIFCKSCVGCRSK